MRGLLLVGLVAVGGVGGWLALRGSGGEPTPAAVTATTVEPARVVKTEHGFVATPVWERRRVASSDGAVASAPAQPSLPVPTPSDDGTATPAQPAAAREVPIRTGADVLRPAPNAVTTDRAVARVEAADGAPVSKSQRTELDKQLVKKQQPVERVPGTNATRERLIQAQCTAPDVQQRYARLPEADQRRFARMCQPYGFTPVQ